MLKPDSWIRRKSVTGMVVPFAERTTKVGEVPVISFGLSSYGYDIRVGNKFKVMLRRGPFIGEPDGPPIIDPKRGDSLKCVDRLVVDHEAVVIPPNSFALAETFEVFQIPSNVLTVCVGKSTYPRYVLNMSSWHRPLGGRCEVCMAGAVMASTLGVDPLAKVAPLEFGGEVAPALFAIDEMRVGHFVDAYRRLHGRKPPNWALSFLDALGRAWHDFVLESLETESLWGRGTLHGHQPWDHYLEIADWLDDMEL